MKIIPFLHSFLCRNKNITVWIIIICFLLLASLLIIGKNSRDSILKEKLNELLTSHVVVSTSNMLCVDNSATNDNNQGGITQARYKLLIYNGPDDCSTCAMSKMSEWNALLNLEREGALNIIFIFSPSKAEKEDLIKSYRSSGLEHPILIDTCGVFSIKNPHIPQEKVFHTLLLDSEDHVVLVGNPLRNDKIKKLFYKILREV